MVIGIIGRIGSGKSTCIEYLKNKYGAIVFSCDNIAKDIIEKNETDYVQVPPVFFFKSEEAQEECRNKIHKLVFDRIEQEILNLHNLNKINNIMCDKNNLKKIDPNYEFDTYNLNKNHFNELIIIECALPGEKLFKLCDKVICIRNSFEKKAELLLKNRNYTENITKLIFDSQNYYNKFYDRADIVIDNDGTVGELEKKIKEVIDEIYIICK